MKCLETDQRFIKILEDPIIIGFILGQLSKKHTHVFFVLKLLKLCNLTNWNDQQTDELYQSLDRISIDEHEQNLVTSVHNPILALALCCELLKRLSDSHSQFKNNSKQTIERFILLGQKLIESYDDMAQLEKLLTELDSYGRSSLEIITELSLNKMICSPKVTRVIDELWAGKEVQRCNGKLQDISCLYSRLLDAFDSSYITFIYDEFGRRTISNKFRFWDVVLGTFAKPKIYDQKYFFQYGFRHSSIEYLYWKEFWLSFLVIVIFQYISYLYLQYFKITNLQIDGLIIQSDFSLNDPILITHVNSLIDAYRVWTQFGLFICATIFIHFWQKMVFSFYTKKRLDLDLWTQIDLLTAICNTFCLYITGSVDAQGILDKINKQNLDFYVCAVVTITWFRFFSYFLIIKRVSKLLITLFTILQSTVSFFFMLGSYWVLASFVFCLQFGMVQPDYYGNLQLSARSLFDDFSSNYSYVDYGAYQRSYDVFLILHMIITRVFLFNYVVAVLTSIYQFMIVEGEYTYSKMRYLFYKKYQKLYVSDKNFIAQLAHKKEHYYSEIVIHPPPLNLIVAFVSILSLPVMWNKDIRLRVLRFSGLVIFWLENILFLLLFLAFELLCAFGVYIKLSIIFGAKMAQKRKAIYFFVIWIFSGLLITLCLSFRDSYFFFKVFQVVDTQSRVIKAKLKKQKLRSIQSIQASVLNEVIDSMRYLFEEIQSKQKYENKKKESEQMTRQKLTQFRSKQELVKRLSDIKKTVLQPDQKEISYTIDKDIIVIAWLKLRKSRIEAARAKHNQANQRASNREPRKSNLLTPSNQRMQSNLLNSPGQPQRLISGLSARSNLAKTYGQKLMQTVLDQNIERRRSSGRPSINRRFSSMTRFMKEFQSKRISNSSKRRSQLRTNINLNNKRRIGSQVHSFKFSNVTSAIYQDSENDSEQQFLRNHAATDNNLINVVDNFLSRFIFVSKYQGHNQVNLKLSLSALPRKLTIENFHTISTINFEKVQMALVAFQNQKTDQLFNYYDSRNKARIHQLNTQAQVTSDLSKELLTFSSATRNKLVKLFKLEREFKKIENQRRQEKDVIRINIQQHPEVKRSEKTVTSDDKTMSLFPVVEESEYGEYDIVQSNQNQEFFVQRKPKLGQRDDSSSFSSPDKQIGLDRRAHSVQSRSMNDKSMEYSIEMSQDEPGESFSGSSFSSFSDVIKEETESNLSSNNEDKIQ